MFPRIVRYLPNYPQRGALTAPRRPAPRAPASPDPYPLSRRNVELVARLHVERCVPVIDVRQRAVDAELRGTVLIGHHQLAQRPIAILLPPHLGVGEEEALITRQAVDHRRGSSLEGNAVGLVSHVEPTKIADVLPDGVGAV